MITRLTPPQELLLKDSKLNENILELSLFLDKNISADWEIFVHPFLNSEKPDVVLLHKTIGIIFIHIFEGKKEDYKVSWEKSNSEKGCKGYKKFQTKSNGKFRTTVYPVSVLTSLTENLINIYVPDIGYLSSSDKTVEKVVKKILYVPNMEEGEARQLFYEKEDDYTYMTKADLTAERISQILIKLQKSQRHKLLPEWYDDIKYWLQPPYHYESEGEPSKLNEKQKNYAYHTPEKFQRATGVAGSGKTFLLAHRAADIASSGKKVLILTYNITLINYIRELLNKMKMSFSFENIVITNYHHFCSIYFRENCIKWPYNNDDRIMFDKEVPALLYDLIMKKVNNKNREYDAILIDEVQDFHPVWIDSIVPLLSNNSELFIVGDDNQDIYGRGTTNLNKIKKGFSGPWGHLDYCYRLPLKIVEETNRFVELYFESKNKIEKYKKNDPLLSDTILYWKNDISTDFQSAVAAYEFLTIRKKVQSNNIVILVPNHKEGKIIAQLLKEKNINVSEIFGERGKKLTFKFNTPGVKICTLQSFKGWEFHTIVLVTPDEGYRQGVNLYKLIYTGLTRALNNLVVINKCPALQEFGNSENWEVMAN